MRRSVLQGLLSFLVVILLGALPVRAQQNGDASGSYAVSDADGAATSGASGERPRRVGSPYVELDSWIYPAIERLAALGNIQDEFLGMRPWTRVECARLVQQAGDLIETARRGPAPIAIIGY